MDKEHESNERLRLERVAVGRICQCGDCYCCDELARATSSPGRDEEDH